MARRRRPHVIYHFPHAPERRARALARARIARARTSLSRPGLKRHKNSNAPSCRSDSPAFPTSRRVDDEADAETPSSADISPRRLNAHRAAVSHDGARRARARRRGE